MRRKIETNDAKRITQLANLIEHAEIRGPDGNRIFEASLIQRLTETHQSLVAIRETYNATLSREREARRGEAREKENLSQVVRNAWHTVLYRVKTSILPASRTSLYGLSVTGKRPRDGDTRRWISLAEEVITGDTEAENLGYPPLGEPNREAIQQQIDRVGQYQIIAETEKDSLNGIREDLKRIRGKTRFLIREAILAVGTACRDDDPVTRRNKMRVLGFQFESQQEPEDEQIAEAS